MGTGSF